MQKAACCILICCCALLCSAQSYRKLHDKAVLVDTHNDVLSTVTMKGLDIDDDLRGRSHSDLNRFREGGVDVQVFSIFCDERYGKGAAFTYANREIDSLYAIAERNRSKIMRAASPAALHQAIKEKKLACMMGVEGGHMIEERMDYLDSFYRRGVRYMTLTWNNSTSWASSAKDETRTDTIFKKGLSDFGRQVVRRMNALGMMVDLSHVGEQTFYDALATTSKPVIASHSSVYALCPVFRNLKDDQIKAIGRNGGVIFVNFYSGFLDSSYTRRMAAFVSRHQTEADSLKKAGRAGYEVQEWLSGKYSEEVQSLRPPLGLLMDHIDYIVKLIGVDHVGLGSDFDGIESAPAGLDGVQDYPLITRALLDRGYKKKAIRKILGGNFMRVFRQNQQ